MADEGDISSEEEKFKSIDELDLESSNNDVRNVFGNFFLSLKYQSKLTVFFLFRNLALLVLLMIITMMWMEVTVARAQELNP